MPRIDEIIAELAAYAPKANLDRLRRAYLFAANMHEGQRRASGDPYIVHPLSVAQILVRLRMDEPTISAALLHDVIEDTPARPEDLRERFGEEIASLVDGVTKVGKIRYRSAEQRQVETFRKMLLATARDLRVLLIKLADRLHNMRTIGFLPQPKRVAIATETLQLYAPLAHRLGIHWIKQELEDLSLAQIDPEGYEEIASKLAERLPRLQALRERIEQLLAEALARQGLRARVQGRLKHIYGIYEKMQRKHVDFEEIYDLVAFRIIVGDVLDCYRALGLVHGLYRPIPGRFKDYIALPKPNGYQSLHTTIIGPDGHRIEVQIRTEAMHRTAEEGIAAHWSYKENRIVDAHEQASFRWLRRMLDLVQAGDDRPDEIIENLRLDLFVQEVYVFSRDGDIFALPRGSTVLDFAYAVHTEVGHQAIAARVNGEDAALDQVLHNGDQVEIITSPDQTPSRHWLTFVRTSRARQAIRQWFRRHERASAIRLGRRILKDVFALETLAADVLQRLRCESEEEALARLGRGEIDWQQLAKALGKSKAEKVALDEGAWMHPASCCRPLPGDAVIGRLRPGIGIELHRHGCPQARRGRQENWIEVRWQPSSQQRFFVGVEMLVRNERGLLARVSTAIAQAGASIEDLQLRQRPGRLAELFFLLEVDSRKQLADVLRALRRTEGVVRVARAQPQAEASGNESQREEETHAHRNDS